MLYFEGLCLQDGDEGYDYVFYCIFVGVYFVVEEKFDGVNMGISFSLVGELLLQLCGYYLVGGGCEWQFGFVKMWVVVYVGWLFECFGDCYVMYGEMMSKKYVVFYDVLLYYFFEFDVFDCVIGCFLLMFVWCVLFVDGFVLLVFVLYEGVVLVWFVDFKVLFGLLFVKMLDWCYVFEYIV